MQVRPRGELRARSSRLSRLKFVDNYENIYKIIVSILFNYRQIVSNVEIAPCKLGIRLKVAPAPERYAFSL